MKKYKCTLCGYIYDPQENNNTEFDNLDEQWVCPLCSADKSFFEEVEE